VFTTDGDTWKLRMSIGHGTIVAGAVAATAGSVSVNAASAAKPREVRVFMRRSYPKRRLFVTKTARSDGSRTRDSACGAGDFLVTTLPARDEAKPGYTRRLGDGERVRAACQRRGRRVLVTLDRLNSPLRTAFQPASSAPLIAPVNAGARNGIVRGSAPISQRKNPQRVWLEPARTDIFRNEDLTVAAIAERWPCSNFGRSGSMYRRRFGELSSATPKRRRPPHAQRSARG
jgi:hypothetical protein